MAKSLSKHLSRSSSNRSVLSQPKDALSLSGHTAVSSISCGSFEAPRVFVGRTKHLEKLMEVNRDGSRVVLIQGPEGCGKTYLLEEFLSQQLPSLTLHSCFARRSPYDDPLCPLWQALSVGLEPYLDIVVDFLPLARCFLPHIYHQVVSTQHLGLQRDYDVTWTQERIQ